MLLNIQALRAAAALLVVIVHLEVLGAPLGLERPLFGLFAVGVDLFFVISGFIMVHTTMRRPVRPWEFLGNRILRIAPLYWVLTLAVFAFALVLPSFLAGTRADWGALARSLAFIPGARGDGSIRPILFVGWSLNLEMAFYCVFALALTVRDAGARVALAIGLLVIAVLFGLAARGYLSPELRFLTQPILLEFAGGMAIGWLYDRLPSSRGAARAAAVIGSAGLVALLVLARWPLPGGWPISLPPACLVVLAALVAEKGGLAFGWRPVQTLGDASYALYLTHPFVTQAWTIGASRWGILTAATAPFLMVGAMICAIAVGIFVHRNVERPIGEKVRRAGAKVGSLTASAFGPLTGAHR